MTRARDPELRAWSKHRGRGTISDTAVLHDRSRRRASVPGPEFRSYDPTTTELRTWHAWCMASGRFSGPAVPRAVERSIRRLSGKDRLNAKIGYVLALPHLLRLRDGRGARHARSSLLARDGSGAQARTFVRGDQRWMPGIFTVFALCRQGILLPVCSVERSTERDPIPGESQEPFPGTSRFLIVTQNVLLPRKEPTNLVIEFDLGPLADTVGVGWLFALTPSSRACQLW